jgi:carbamoyl-phosphate synthase large subunit
MLTSRRWFLYKLQNIVDCAREIEGSGGLQTLRKEQVVRAKKLGFSDHQIALALGVGGNPCKETDVRAYRKELGVTPFVKKSVLTTSLADCNLFMLTTQQDRHTGSRIPG